MSLQPDATLQLGGVRATGHLSLYPGDGYRVWVQGGAIGSIRATSRTAGALSSDYSVLGLDRGGSQKWAILNNGAGDGNDNFTIVRDNDGLVSSKTAMKITRTSLRVDFYGDVYVNGNPIGTSGASVAKSGDTMTGSLTIAGSTAAGTHLTVGDPMPASITSSGDGPKLVDYPLQLVGYNQANIFMTANINLSSPDGGGNLLRSGAMGMSSDGGLRFATNHWHRNSDGAEVIGQSLTPSAQLGLDSYGFFNFKHIPPTSKGADPYAEGQTLVIGGLGGWGLGTDNASTAYVNIFTPQAGRKIRFSTAYALSSIVPIATFHEAKGAGDPGTIDLFGPVVIKSIPGGRHGWLIFDSAASDPVTTYDGSMWFDGTDFKCIIGDVVKTFTVT